MLKPSRDTRRLEFYTPAKRGCVVSRETIETIIYGLQYKMVQESKEPGFLTLLF
jgi:hypothetical protein